LKGSRPKNTRLSSGDLVAAGVRQDLSALPPKTFNGLCSDSKQADVT